MKWMQQTARGVAVIVLVLILVGCSTPTTTVTQPTQDVPSIRTESAQTVVAKLTYEAALNPSPTADAPQAQEPLVITATPLPATPTSAASPTPLAAAGTATLAPTLAPTRVTGGGGGGVVYPTATRRAGPDQAQLIEQSPKDGTKFNAGEEFDVAWTFKNIGTSTWTVNYDYRFDRGAGMSRETIYTLPKEVKPGETVTIYADYKAPSTSGRYVDYWELTNVNGDVFYAFYVVIDVP